MYNLANFIVENRGKNGVVLLNTKSGEYISFNTVETIEYDKIMQDEANNNEHIMLINKLLRGGWIVEVENHCKIELPFSMDFAYDESNISAFNMRRVIIELDTKCPLGCYFCDEHSDAPVASCFCKKWNYQAKSYNYEKLIEKMIFLGVREIIILGGDPFNNLNSYENIKAILDEVNKLGPSVVVGIAVNGYTLNIDIIKTLSIYRNLCFNIQLIGCNEEQYYKITKIKGIYDRVLKNILLIKKFNINLMLTLLISDPMMDEKMDEIKSLNVPIVKKFIYNIPVLSKEILNDYNQRIQKTDYLTYQVRKNVNSCLYGQIFIAANQEIYPCPYLRDFKLGDLHNDTISSILHKGEYRKFWYMAKSKIKPCNDCKHNVQCFDCRAIEYSVEKKIDSEYYCSQRELF